jgi:hypothetical protein
MDNERRAPLIMPGEPQTILHYGAKPMQRASEWEQRHSDELAQFLDVASIISRSTWRHAQFKLGLSDPADSDLPPFESLVFVGIYFRQLFGGDNLFRRAVNIHARFTSSEPRRHWVKWESKAAAKDWDSPPFVPALSVAVGGEMLVAGERPKLRELFSAFLYGAYVLHSIGAESEKSAKMLRELLNQYPKNIVLGCLHAGLMQLQNHVNHVAVAVEQDFRLWVHTESLPPPAIHWQQKLFSNDSGNYAFDRPPDATGTTLPPPNSAQPAPGS